MTKVILFLIGRKKKNPSQIVTVHIFIANFFYIIKGIKPNMNVNVSGINNSLQVNQTMQNFNNVGCISNENLNNLIKKPDIMLDNKEHLLNSQNKK